MINREFFFHQVRQQLFSGLLSAKQFTGLTGILNEWSEHHSDKDDRWLAYILATVHHETDRTFRPIKEYGGAKYFTRMYDPSGERSARAKRMGNTTPGDGPKYCGRGFVQLTWKNNYAAMSPVCGVDLVGDPDQAMQLPIATKILFYGMMEGSFTGKKFADFFTPVKSDWVQARRIINDLDKANLISDYGLRYYSAISYTT